MSSERVGFLGLGTMGAAMAANLARAGFAVTAWNRSPGRAPELDALGVSRSATPADVARSVDVLVICVSDTPDVEAVVFGPDGVASGARAGQLVIDCSTIAPPRRATSPPAWPRSAWISSTRRSPAEAKAPRRRR
jgi:3-hydroxyisobutyrate dehydrogenase-like beta-hydroxyacid dehydrogenase